MIIRNGIVYKSLNELQAIEMWDVFDIYALHPDGTEAEIDSIKEMITLMCEDVTIAIEVGPSELTTFADWCIKQVVIDNEQRIKHRDNMLPEWRINQLMLMTNGQMCYEANKAILKFKSLNDIQA